VLSPTHPGFAGEPRPEWFDSIDDLAIAYLELLDKKTDRGHHDTTRDSTSK
jgi:hypothetical protein